MPQKSNKAAAIPPARNFGELLTQLKQFEGVGVFSAAERMELRKRQLRPVSSRARLKKTAHAA